jgi:hypothetical protein
MPLGIQYPNERGCHETGGCHFTRAASCSCSPIGKPLHPHELRGVRSEAASQPASQAKPPSQEVGSLAFVFLSWGPGKPRTGTVSKARKGTTGPWNGPGHDLERKKCPGSMNRRVARLKIGYHDAACFERVLCEVRNFAIISEFGYTNYLRFRGLANFDRYMPDCMIFSGRGSGSFGKCLSHFFLWQNRKKER